ncbi:MAG: hypothetical protein NVSMB14_02880 [Isosphaeraceae bacterium]
MAHEPFSNLAVADVLTAPSTSIRVLHCASGQMFGGVETTLATLARGGEFAPGLRQEFAFGFDARALELTRESGAPVHLVGPARFSRPWTILAARKRLKELLIDRRIEIVVCHGAWTHALFAPVVHRAGIPLIFWQHDATLGKHWTERLSSRTPPDLAIVNSRFTAELISRVFPTSAAEVMHYPVAAPTFDDRDAVRAEVRRELNTPENAVVIVQACRMERWKGHADLIAALGLLKDRPEWVAWIAGGAQREHENIYLKELIESTTRLGIVDRVRFLGQRGDVPKLLAAADIHCQPTPSPEPFGIAFVEALHAGLPVVSTRIGGALEIIDDSCGRLVPPGDVSALAETLSALIVDPDLRSRLGENGPARARALCDPAMISRRFETLLTRVVQGVRNR